jgi:hypothetical protein
MSVTVTILAGLDFADDYFPPLVSCHRTSPADASRKPGMGVVYAAVYDGNLNAPAAGVGGEPFQGDLGIEQWDFHGTLV